jgi:hypothetical protein
MPTATPVPNLGRLAGAGGGEGGASGDGGAAAFGADQAEGSYEGFMIRVFSDEFNAS